MRPAPQSSQAPFLCTRLLPSINATGGSADRSSIAWFCLLLASCKPPNQNAVAVDQSTD